MANDPVSSISSLAETAINKIWPNAGEEDKNKLDAILALVQAQTSVIVAEANSESWLTCNWRPLTMVTFTALIVARWFGLAAPNLTEAEYLKLWDIVQLGLGGYTIGRTAEKIIPQLMSKGN